MTYMAREGLPNSGEALPKGAPRGEYSIHDRNLYTTTNTCLQCLIKIMYTVF